MLTTNNNKVVVPSIEIRYPESVEIPMPCRKIAIEIRLIMSSQFSLSLYLGDTLAY